jgi:hypothetical protein
MILVLILLDSISVKFLIRSQIRHPGLYIVSCDAARLLRLSAETTAASSACDWPSTLIIPDTP